MMRWGWRPLIASVFISVLVAGCAITSESAPTTSPTEYPPVTLMSHVPNALAPPMFSTPTPYIAAYVPATADVAQPTSVTYIVQSGDTLLDIALRFGIDVERLRFANNGIDPINLQTGQMLIIPAVESANHVPPLISSATPLPVLVKPPTCFESTAARVLCMGIVESYQPEPVERIALSVQLLGRTGEPVAEKLVTVEQRVLPADASAPYGVVFDLDWEQFAGVAVMLRSAEPAKYFSERFVRIDIENSAGGWVGGRFVVSAVLVNPGPRHADGPYANITLQDADGRVVGYRMLQFETPLLAGERLPIHAELIPQAGAVSPLVYMLHVDAPVLR